MSELNEEFHLIFLRCLYNFMTFYHIDSYNWTTVQFNNSSVSKGTCNPMDCSPQGSSVHEDSPGKNTGVDCHTLLQGIFPTQNWTQVSCIAGRFFTIWATRGDYQHTSIRKEPGYATLRLWIPAFIYDIESTYLNRDLFIVFSRVLCIWAVSHSKYL